MVRSIDLVLCVVASTICGIESLELTSATWDEQLKGKTAFIKFYAPWCGHCKKIKPDWDKLMRDFQGSPTGLVAEVDCTAKGKDLCERHGVKGYPGLMWGTHQGLQAYNGPRNYEEMKRFADDHLGKSCGPDNLDLCPEEKRALLAKFKRIAPDRLDEIIGTADSQIKRAEHAFAALERDRYAEISAAEQKKNKKLKSIRKKHGLAGGHSEGNFELTQANWDERVAGKNVFVKFYAPWCGHCKALKPDWDRLMLDFDGTLTALVAEVDCTDKGKTLCDAHGVTGFPRLMWGRADSLSVYKGPRTYEDLKRFAVEHLGETCGPENLDLCDESHKEGLEDFASMSAEKRKAKASSAEKAIEKAEKVFADTQWRVLGEIDLAEEKKNKQVKAVRDQGLSEAKQVQAWNKRQPPGFWKPPPAPQPASVLTRVVFTAAGHGVTVLECGVALAVASLALLVFISPLGRRAPTVERSCVLRHILMESEEEILKAKARLDAGEAFGDVAGECSTCRSGQEGGALGRRLQGSMQPALDEVCFSPETKLGEILGPIKTKFGFHLVVVDAREGVSGSAASRTVKEPKGREAAKDK